MNQDTVAVVERYLDAIRTKNLAAAPLAEQTRFEDPLAGTLAGRAAVIAFISEFLPAVNGVEVKRHVAEGEHVATLWHLDSAFGIVPIFECFRVVDGEIVEALAYFDPRPILDGTR
jgi:limonene-1,2-epoxide hydrolase